MNAVYIHIPFCKKICSYCDFCKVLYQEKWLKQYLDNLKKEIEEAYHAEEIKTIYIGGGTPSSLDQENLKYLLEITKIFKKAPIYEFSFECNINDLNEALLNILKDYGINRLSIGIESFNKKKLKFMERETDYKTAQEKIALARNLGFNNINLDLIYGIPRESLHNLKKDLKLLISLKPDHISTYSLIIEDNTKIGITHMNPIDEDLDYEMYKLICKTLTKNQYNHYEISNFARPGYESKHNLTYWHNNEYYGFGLGASGYIGNIRYKNTKNLSKYLNGNYLDTKELLSKQDEMDNELMLNLRLLKGLSLQEFYDKYQVNLQEVYNIKELLKNKELLYKDGYIYINPKYLYTMNEILIKII